MTSAVMHPKRPREDDTLECFLYPRFCYCLNTDQITEEMLNSEIQMFKQDIELYVKDYLWHRDPLVFDVRTKQTLQFDCIIENSLRPTDLELLPHIHVNLRFDEDIGDEWFVVFLIMNLTKKYEGLIARMIDSDGEFLLIEAAEEIPSWATPEACQNRVFMMNGAVHAVQDKQKICINILNSVHQNPHMFRLSDKVQAVIQKKISIYPEEIVNRKHKARAYLPEKAAYILRKEPKLVASAIRTICHSDPLERKVCRGMRYFPPEQRIMENVKMTKCLYAMASHCRYTGDLRTGWNLPPANSPKYNAYLLGIKIACGLEMLLERAHEELRKCEKQLADNKSPVLDDEAWSNFLKRLESSGYFRELLEGSRERQSLLEKAKSYYRLHMSCNGASERLESRETQRLLKVYKDIQSNDMEMESTEVCTLSPEDNDNWLNVDPIQLETMLNQQFGMHKKKIQQPLNLQDKVQAFINQRSGVEGVRFYVDNDTDIKPPPDMEDNNRIDFDPDVFDSALRDILDFVVPGEDGEFVGSSDSELGGDGDDLGGEMDKYMQLLDSQLQEQMIDSSTSNSMSNRDTMEANLLGSIKEEAGGTGPLSNILGGPVEKLKHLQLNSTDNEAKDVND
ncbi:PREDICTED: protein SGT1 homolog ecdysoneless [Ceratosolen solmsi marchali]|uniref:Protein SGT1 homolog ecdysoneless n=1 Tax=Ceratosolen solmsi marchali TaxID=326594 RepID=A0AAJ6YE50_9HYME|nr:PREDICTED: protein SGT1 homolog ecdysoneless [Ceratosolen solmsi marchali]